MGRRMEGGGYSQKEGVKREGWREDKIWKISLEGRQLEREKERMEGYRTRMMKTAAEKRRWRRSQGRKGCEGGWR